MRWREADNIPPAARFVSSPYDVDAHYPRKHTTPWVGYTVHLTETCDDDLPHLITHVETTPGPTADGVATPRIRAALLVESPEHYGVDLLGPTRLDYHWQARARPALTPSSSRLSGIGGRPPVRPARRVSAGRPPSRTASMRS